MRNLLLAAALLVTAIAGCSKPDKPVAAPTADKAGDKAEDKLAAMTVDEVEHAIAANEVKAVDSNGDLTRKKMGVVPSAILLTSYDTFPASELPADKASKLVFYCADPG